MAATAFITLAEFKSFLDPNFPADTTADTLYTAVIAAVCETIEEYLQRPVVARSLTATTDGDGERIWLTPQVFSLTSITEDGTSITVSGLKTNDYAVYAKEGYIVRLRSGDRYEWKVGKRVQTVSIVYTAGVAANVAGVPENIKLAAKIAAKFYIRHGAEDHYTRMGDGMMIRPERFPNVCLWLLQPYKAVTIV